MLLPLAEDPAQLLCESGTACALAEQSQFIFMPLQQCTQNHCAAFIVQQFWRRDIKFFKNKLREPLKGKNVQPHVTVEGTMGEQLAFELESGRRDLRRVIGRVAAKSLGWQTHFPGGSAAALSFAARRTRRARGSAAATCESEGFQRSRQRNRHLHRGPQRQLHERLQCLLQVLRVLSRGKGRRFLRHHARRTGQKNRGDHRARRHADVDAGRASSEIDEAVVSRSAVARQK
jgi:hypothetical protein